MPNTTAAAPREVRIARKDWDDYGMWAYARKADQATAGYNPLGGTKTKACANCLFFGSPNRCTVVDDYPVAISPTGLSNYWTAIPSPQDYPPMRVIIVEDDGGMKAATAAVPEPGLFDRVITAVKAVFGDAPTAAPKPAAAASKGPLRLYKSADGSWYWVAWVSNNGRDRDQPAQILSDAAHKDFVAYLDGGGDYPEAWLWHTPGTRWGTANWADYTDGILTMAGPVDKGMEHIAEKLASEEIGVSHGFHFLYSDKAHEVIGWYRSFEISALPPWAAANEFTGMDVVQKELEMAFTPAKRMWLTEKLGAGAVADLETKSGDVAAALAAAGVERKDIPEGVLDAPAQSASAKEIGEAAAAAILASPAFKDIGDGVAGLKAQGEQQNGRLTALEAAVKELQKSDDAKVADAFTAARDKALGSGGYRPTQDAATVLKEGDPLAVQRPMIDGGFAASMR